MKYVHIFVCLLMLFVYGCGNSGGESAVLGSVFPKPASVIGTASEGVLITEKTVKLKDAEGKSAVNAITDATTGTYKIDVTGLTAPFLLTVTGANGRYVSLARTAGTANINPITTMVVALAAGTPDVISLFADLTPDKLAAINSNYSSKTALVNTSLSAVLPSGAEIEDYFTGEISAGTGIDALFNAYQITIGSSTGITFKTNNSSAATALNIPVATITANTNEPLPVLVNLPPVANAGTVQNIDVGSTVTLDGSASSDADGDTLTYNWVLTSRPDTSIAVLSSATDVKPTFTADVLGDYVITLVVSDGKVQSASSSVTITASAANAAPVANAGQPQTVIPGATVTLDGSASSDAEGATLTYLWSFMTVPNGSNAVLTGTTTVNPTFTPDLAGDYVITLVVSDGRKQSTLSSIVTITASVSGV